MWNTINKIWMFDDPRSYGARALLRGAADGLRACGKDVAVFESNPDDPNDAKSMRDHLVESRPDTILLGNHPSSQFFRQLGLKAPPCPVFVWLFDDPFIMGDDPFALHDIVLAADPGFIEGAKVRGAQKVIFLPVAAPINVEAEPSKDYACPVAYVGSAMKMEQARNSMEPAITGYLDSIIERKLNDPHRTFPELLEENPLAEGKQVQWNGKLAYYLYTEANRQFRVRHLVPLTHLGLRIYGNDVWKDELAGSDMESCFYGRIDPITNYPNLIVSAMVNLNLRSFQGFTAPTQRDFLVPMLGGFMISTPTNSNFAAWQTHDADGRFGLLDFPWSPEMDSIDSAVETVLRFLNEPIAAEEWKWQAKGEIEDRHTFAHRMEQLGQLYDETFTSNQS